MTTNIFHRRRGGGQRRALVNNIGLQLIGRIEDLKNQIQRKGELIETNIRINREIC